MACKRKEFMTDTLNLLAVVLMFAIVLLFAKFAFAFGYEEQNDNGITVQRIGQSTYIDYGESRFGGSHTLACQTVGSITHCDQTN